MKKLSYALSVAAVVGSLVSSNAQAVTGLEELIRNAREHANLNRIAMTQIEARYAQRDRSFWLLFPKISVSLGYRYNPTVISTSVLLSNGFSETRALTPHNQVDAGVTLTVPLFDLEAFRKYQATKENVELGRYEAKVEQQKIDVEVARAYFQAAVGTELLERGRAALGEAETLASLAESRVGSGTATRYDADRAHIEVERGNLLLTELSASFEESARTLEMFAGVTANSIQSSLELPGSIDSLGTAGAWLARGNEVASAAAARQRVRVADADVRAARAGLFPRLTGDAVDRLSNAPGFDGNNNNWNAGLTVSWNWDFGMPANIRNAQANRRIETLRLEQTIKEARNAILTAFSQVEVRRAKYLMALSNFNLLKRNADEARLKYESGLESVDVVTRLKREALIEEIGLIQSYGDYRFARILLDLSAGQDIARR